MKIPQTGAARFTVEYSIQAGTYEEAKELAFGICVEQTIEFPYDLVTDAHFGNAGYIRDTVTGRIENLEKRGAGYTAAISYADETVGREFTQFLNVLFGNTSLKPGIRVESIALSPALHEIYKGPRFGVAGIRALTGAGNRPLICAALKPLGLPARELAELAYKFALGGIDLIKDDHGLADQPLCPFAARTEACAAAVRKANSVTGGNTLYLPNITGDTGETAKRARFARETGAGAVIVSAALTGFDTMRAVADDPAVNLPVFFHPAFAGVFTSSPVCGISHYALYGQLARIAGADAVIFPNFGGRFSFSSQECSSIVAGCSVPMGRIRDAFPAPGGGMSFATVKNMVKFYKQDVIFLIGGGLFQYSTDITRGAADLKAAVLRESV